MQGGGHQIVISAGTVASYLLASYTSVTLVTCIFLINVASALETKKERNERFVLGS